MRRRTLLLAAGAGLLGAPALAACSPQSAADVRRIMVPNQPGGGYDATARAAAKIMRSQGISQAAMDVFNLPGGSGRTATARLIGEHGNPNLVLMMGLGLVGAFVGSGRQDELLRATPVARVVTEPGVFMVPRGSAFKDLDGFLAAWRKAPRTLRIGGGSAVGGPDHLLPLLLARQLGIDPADVVFVPHDGGGGLMPSLLDGSVDVGVSGAGEYLPHIASGGVRVLAVSGDGPSPLAGVNAPTLGAAGHRVDFLNWRGVLAPPGLDAAPRQAWGALWSTLDADTEWASTCRSFAWSRAALGAEDFGVFLRAQLRQVAELLAELKVKPSL